MYKLIIIIIITVIIAGGGYLFFSGNSSQNKITIKEGELKDKKEVVISEEEKTKEESPGEAIMGNSLTKSTLLKDVTGKSATGIAYVLRVDNTLQHYVEATLPELKVGNEYEGWLVKKSPTLKFFSTGIMTKEADGEYTLLFSVDDFKGFTKGYDLVVITEETVIDETPETHILEGIIK